MGPFRKTYFFVIYNQIEIYQFIIYRAVKFYGIGLWSHWRPVRFELVTLLSKGDHTTTEPPAVWPDRTIFEISWQQILLQK